MVCFPGRNKIDCALSLDVDGVSIETKRSMRYLGVILDDRLSFGVHLDYVEGKVASVSRVLCRVTPNLRGPRESRRRLYGGVVLSVILYAAPIWSETVSRSRKSRERLNGFMRTVNLRIISCYRTVSLEAASILVRMPPVHLQASMRRRMYLRVTDLRLSGQMFDQRIREIREEERLLMIRQWSINLQRGGISGVRVRDAVLPCLSAWLERNHGSMEFHLTQLFTGHDCFGSYLCRIQRVESDACEHCGSGAADTADHTLQECVAWAGEREALRRIMGDDLSLGSGTREILNSKDSWRAMTEFARGVMRRKEKLERERERQSSLSTPSPQDTSDLETDGSRR